MRRLTRGAGGRGPAEELLELLAGADATLATAESLTGGRLAAAVTGVPGASRSYLGGVVSYATELKERVLGVPHALVEQYGVVSAECARAMASGCRELTGATYALATTGVAGPEPQEGKPIGTVYVGIAGPDLLHVLSLELVGRRDQIQDRACREALSALCGILRSGQREQPLLG